MSRSLIRLALAALVLGMAVSAAGCGKRSALTPPEGEEKEYTYPKKYPK